MKIITSPAKLMHISHHQNYVPSSTPIFIKDSEFIQSFLKQKTPQFLSELMEISNKIADENWERNQKWNIHPTSNESCQALYAFTGEVYRGLGADSLDATSVEYLNKHYRILSGLYGLLKPSDTVMLYRLEMGIKFQFGGYSNLYSFWKEKITSALNDELGDNDFILNLASNEYFKAIDTKKINAKIINFQFYEIKSGKPKTIVVYTKHARGLVTRFCAENKVETIDKVKAFNYEGYLFNEELSSDTNFVFTR